MAGNHYSGRVQQLEAILEKKQHEVTMLLKENELLQHRETALHNAIHGIAGPLAVIKEVLEAPAGVMPLATGCKSEGSKHSSSSSDSPCLRMQSGDLSSSADLGGAPRPWPAVTHLLSATASYKVSSACRQQLDCREREVQCVLQELGCYDEVCYPQLYTTQLLMRALADPECVSSYMKTARLFRLQFIRRTFAQMALLIGKYDTDVSTAAGSSRQQVEYLVDEMFERVMVCGLLEPAYKYMECYMFNLEGQAFEPYPPGWWTHVVKGIAMSEEQQDAINIVWCRVQAKLQHLTQEYEQLQRQLQRLHQEQILANASFEADLKQLAEWQQRQARKERASADSASAVPQGSSACHTEVMRQPVLLPSRLEAMEEVLLQAGPVERQALERRLQAVMDQIKVLNYCLSLQLTNTLSKKQLAAMCVHSHPFMWDALSICEALGQLHTRGD